MIWLSLARLLYEIGTLDRFYGGICNWNDLLSLRKGTTLMELSAIMIISILALGFALFAYVHKDNTSLTKLIDRISYFENKVKYLDRLELEMASKSFDAAQHRIQIDSQVKRLQEELEIMQGLVAKTREAQIGLREILSRKRPIMRMDGPIAIEIHETTAPKISRTRKDKAKRSLDQ